MSEKVVEKNIVETVNEINDNISKNELLKIQKDVKGQLKQTEGLFLQLKGQEALLDHLLNKVNEEKK